MAPLVRTQVKVPGRSFETTVWRGGSGEPVVFLHGAGALSPRDPALARLSESFEVIAPVHPGFSRIEELDELEDVHDLALYHDDLLGVLGLEQASVIGHSFGAMVAAELAAHVPSRVGKLVLISSVGLWRDEDPIADLLSTQPAELPRLLWADPESTAAKEAMGVMADPAADPVEQMLAASRGITAAMKYLWPIPDHGLSRRLYRIRAKTLVLWGAQDRLAPASYANDFAAGIPTSRVEILENAGHLVTYERLDDSTKLITDFLTAP